ncbi:MAG: hypothetical protein PHG48_01410 [Eubacteriales bacterium]|nr:hypothetical protein [Eubacteriales bacterium]
MIKKKLLIKTILMIMIFSSITNTIFAHRWVPTRTDIEWYNISAYTIDMLATDDLLTVS